jgi:hypothetical protein
MSQEYIYLLNPCCSKFKQKILMEIFGYEYQEYQIPKIAKKLWGKNTIDGGPF